MIGLVDTTVRDGHQSLWSADALTTAMIAEIAPVMDRVGFHAIDFTSSTHMAMAVRSHAEDPWERIRAVRERMPETRARLHHAGHALHGLAARARRGDAARARLRDPQRDPARLGRESMNDVETDVRVSRIAKEAGAEEVLVGLVYSISPVHSDDYYATRATRDRGERGRRRALPQGSRRAADARARAHARPRPARRRAGLPLEVHSHCTATMAPLVYLESARLGASFLCTAVAPLANGTSQPSAEQTVANLRARASRSSSTRPRWPRCRVLLALATRIGRPVGVPAEYDVAIYRHQLPGGMTSTLRRQLREVGLESRWDEVLEESRACAKSSAGRSW